MDYPESLDYLRRLGNEVLTMKFGLKTIQTLLVELGAPQLKFPSILIAGTNGKGSVARFLAGILNASGARTGLYTSPHLVKVEERFVIDQEPIGPTDFAQCLTEVVGAIKRARLPYHPTYFETLTAVGFLYFARQSIDVAVLEVGMGGRLDSTNAVDPLLSIITPIGFDHQQYLGNTIDLIAAEKAGIIHAGRPVLVAPQTDDAFSPIRQRAEELGARLYQLDQGEVSHSSTPDGLYALSYHGLSAHLQMYGEHQVWNAALAIRASELLAERFPASIQAVAKGLERMRMPGRIQRISERPLVLLDGAHNPEAAVNLVRFLQKHTPGPRTLVFGMMRDKDIRTVAEILRPCFSRVYVTSVNSPRAASTEELLGAFPEAIPVSAAVEGLRLAKPEASTVVATGSFYLVGEILKAKGLEEAAGATGY
jgi:dihydrofolate synthase/folylpolyglutamate synthase